jgi:hypothetical protein
MDPQPGPIGAEETKKAAKMTKKHAFKILVSSSLVASAIHSHAIVATPSKSSTTTTQAAPPAAPPAATKSPDTKPDAATKQKALIVDKPSFVFIRATPEAYKEAVAELKKKYPDSEDTGEIASDVGYYEMQVADYATRKKMPVIETDQLEVIFKKKDGTEFRVKNAINHIGQDIYMFDGKKNPQMIKDQAMFDDGKEFQSYFGKVAKKSK